MSTFRRRLMMQSQYAIYTILSDGEGAKIYFDGVYTGVDITNGKGIVKIKKSEAKEKYTVSLQGGNIYIPSDIFVFNVQSSVHFSKYSASNSISITSYKIHYTAVYLPSPITAGETITINYEISDSRQNVSYYVDTISSSFIYVSGNRISVEQNDSGYTRSGQVIFQQIESNKVGACQVTQSG